MRALSIRQPWAHLIATGEKSIEVRSWGTRYRGALLVVASGTIERVEAKSRGLDPRALATCCAVCVVTLETVRPLRGADWPAANLGPADDHDPPDGFAWVLSSPRAVDPVAIRGKLSLFEVDDRLIRYCAPAPPPRRAALTLGRDGMGDEATEADFDAWTSYVAEHIDERTGLDVTVDQASPRDVQTDAVRAASEDDEQTVREALAALWDSWCADGAPGAEPA